MLGSVLARGKSCVRSRVLSSTTSRRGFCGNARPGATRRARAPDGAQGVCGAHRRAHAPCHLPSRGGFAPLLPLRALPAPPCPARRTGRAGRGGAGRTRPAPSVAPGDLPSGRTGVDPGRPPTGGRRGRRHLGPPRRTPAAGGGAAGREPARSEAPNGVRRAAPAPVRYGHSAGVHLRRGPAESAGQGPFAAKSGSAVAVAGGPPAPGGPGGGSERRPGSGVAGARNHGTGPGASGTC